MRSHLTRAGILCATSLRVGACGLTCLLATGVATAAPLPRPAPVAGTIVTVKGGETASLIPDPRLRPAEQRQDLKPGDTLRTNASGTMAIVFADQTQIRLGRNSTLVVKAVAGGAPSALRLEGGSLWARAPRNKTRLSIETPSATAAIRGTDWAITATDDRTDLEVFDGEIEFFNDQGRLAVTEGQAAVAELGKAPSRVVIVNSTEREQMLFYFPLDAALSVFHATPAQSREARAEVARIAAIPPASRSAADWLAYAESGIRVRPHAEIATAIAAARAGGLAGGEVARADFIDGWMLAGDRRWPEALAAFDRALAATAGEGLDGHRATVAAYLRYVAIRRVDPDSTPQPPAPDADQPASYLGRAYLAAYAGDLQEAGRVAAEGVARFPGDIELLSIEGALGVLLDDRAMLERSIAATLAIDPDHAETLRLRGLLRAQFNGDPDGAIADLRRATELEPASSTFWSAYAEALSDRGADRESLAAMRKGVAAEPGDPLIRTNHALTLLDLNRIEEGKAELDKALELDPTLSVVRGFLGRYAMQKGDYDQALEDLLAASAADPAYAETLLMLGATYYRRGEYDVALQQLDAADRLDPAGIAPPLFRAAIALDRFDLDTAIRSAREATRRFRARGGIYANMSENRGTGSYIAGAFRFLDLNDWARYYGDRVFDSFTPSAYFDQVNGGAVDPYLTDQTPVGFAPEEGQADQLSILLQGLVLEPLNIASSNRRLQLMQEQFFEVNATGGVTAANGDATGNGSVGVQGLTFGPVPLSFAITATKARDHGPIGVNNDRGGKGVTALIGAELTPFDKLVLFGQYDDRWTEAPGQIGAERADGEGETQQRTHALYGVYSHEFGYRNMLSLGGSWLSARHRVDRLDGLLFQLPDDLLIVIADAAEQRRTTAWSATAGWAVGVGDVDLRFGADFAGRKDRVVTDVVYSSFIGGELVDVTTYDERTRDARNFDRYYLDVRAEPIEAVILQGRVASTEGAVDRNLDWHAGIAVEPAEGQWFRAAFVRQTSFPAAFTLAPARVAGLAPNVAPVPTGGRTESAIMRWDAEWTPHFFTSVEYQHQQYQAVSFDRPDILANFNLDPDFAIGPASYDYGPGHASRLTVSGNLWLTGNIGLTAQYARSSSAIETANGEAGAIPFLPRDYGRLGVSWTDPRRIKLSANASYVGSRRSEILTTRLGDYVSVDLAASWESPDRHFQIDLGVTNLLDADYEIASAVPGWGRTATASLTVRF